MQAPPTLPISRPNKPKRTNAAVPLIAISAGAVTMVPTLTVVNKNPDIRTICQHVSGRIRVAISNSCQMDCLPLAPSSAGGACSLATACAGGACSLATACAGGACSLATACAGGACSLAPSSAGARNSALYGGGGSLRYAGGGPLEASCIKGATTPTGLGLIKRGPQYPPPCSATAPWKEKCSPPPGSFPRTQPLLYAGGDVAMPSPAVAGRGGKSGPRVGSKFMLFIRLPCIKRFRGDDLRPWNRCRNTRARTNLDTETGGKVQHRPCRRRRPGLTASASSPKPVCPGWSAAVTAPAALTPGKSCSMAWMVAWSAFFLQAASPEKKQPFCAAILTPERG